MIGTTVQILAALIFLFAPATAIEPQARDHLTPQEVEVVKEAQILDKRIDVFVKAIDRRLLVINGAELASAKQTKKDAEIWGDLPTGSRAELIADIAGILDEAITNIDDVNSRDERNPLIAKALRKLSAAVTHITAQLAPLKEQRASDAEVAGLEQLNESAQSILEAANKLPPEVEKKKTKPTEN
ncbi:MAG: hypothetical protein ABR555_03940 [Pyrinomonadaceae bacterium]